MKIRYVDYICLKLGENAKENWELISETKNNNFYWVHLDSFPSGHVIIETQTPTTLIINEAGKFCLENTKYRSLKNVHAVITRVSNLILSDKIGQVEFKSKRKTTKFSL
tara:strand:+ start:2242 stop:2568 length:327 start_codon:yes stop_codon:yes gene_type:complete